MTVRPMSQEVHHGQMSASLVAVSCLLRGLPLFVGARPKTPLRVLCMIAFNTLHVLRRSTALTRAKLKVLATFLDFGACANAALDHKIVCASEFQLARQQLEGAGIGALADEYLRQLQVLESRRPSPGGDHRRFEDIRSYREEVVRLSLGAVEAIALGNGCVDDGIRATHCEDIETLFRIVMQCQIIDDVLDYSADSAAGLPSFLTASASLPQAMEWTVQAARRYSTCRDLPQSRSLFPLRIALFVVSALTKLVVRIGRARRLRGRNTPQLRGEQGAGAACWPVRSINR